MISVSERDSTVEFTSPFGPVDLVWTDPPFGTGKKQAQRGNSYQDGTPDEAVEMVVSALDRIDLAPQAVICVCADYRIIHDVVVRLSSKFTFMGEVIWTFGLGRPRMSWWPNRHNTIATFAAGDSPWFDPAAIPTEIRKAPKAGYPDTKPAGSVWDKTLSNTDPERVGYPNQKPLSIIEPFILAHTSPGGVVADPFMGSGSVGEAAVSNNRRFVGQDTNPEAIEISTRRLSALFSERTQP